MPQPKKQPRPAGGHKSVDGGPARTRPTYTHEQKVAILAALAANNGNISKTARETGVSRDKLREWQASTLQTSPEVVTLKKELSDSYRSKLKRAREAALDRMLELLPHEHDLHKVTGAAKILSELNITEEVADDLSNRSSAGVPATDGATPPADAPATRLN
ncbi:transposase [Deinococcus apachensis]|uniref:transposase n=1 Tax=Deinococcus apachensis TaxID=309886 RepID=UPI00036E26FD|nr:transposase [Deinococcus apachensis]